MSHLWTISEDSFDPGTLHHKETIYTLGNGYLSTRGAFEEGYPGEQRATFIHGVFDAAPIVFTELANAPDWLPFSVHLNGERFALDRGQIQAYRRVLDLRNAVLTRVVRWRSPSGAIATLTFERFAALADPHMLFLRCTVATEFEGGLEFRAALNGNMYNPHADAALVHWRWLEQGERDGIVYLHDQTRTSNIAYAGAMRLAITAGREVERMLWDVENAPTIVIKTETAPGRITTVEKVVSVFTSRDVDAARVVERAVEAARNSAGWVPALEANTKAWDNEWARTDVVIEGDDEAQLAIRFNLYHMLIAAPRDDDRVNIGAKSLSGFGYRGHAFWDTEIFMLPLFTFTAPHIARNLLNYRYHHLPAARAKAKANGWDGAWFAWESADTGEEVTPIWLPDPNDRTRLVRIWTGDLAIHISADIAYAVYQYWRVTGDDAWFVERGAELILDTAKFWASRAEWNVQKGRYEYKNVIGPDEYHDRVNNNAYTNRFAQWNLQIALKTLDWLSQHAPAQAAELIERLDLSETRLAKWREVIDEIWLHAEPSGLIEQFEGFFKLKDVNLADYEPRSRSMQEIFGVDGANEYQAIKQPDVLMLQYLLLDHYTEESIRVNYDYYNLRTDHTYGSSLGPSIQAIVACMMGYPEDAYEHFIRAARADLRDVRRNAGDGIHAASAAGTWQAVVFGFGGLRVTPDGWTTHPRLPKHWKRLTFKFFHRGELVEVDLKPDQGAVV
jgi:kojibiose phosphorylase